MKKTIATILLILLLNACQQQVSKPTTELSLLDQHQWQQRQQQAMLQLKQKNFNALSQSVRQMMSIIDGEQRYWEFIRSLIAYMPIKQAEPLMQQALSRQQIQNSPEQLFGFARLYTQYKDLEKALKLTNQAIKINKTEEYTFWRARLLLTKQDFKQAEKDYRWLLKKQPDHEPYISQYIALLNHQGRVKEAQKLLKKHQDSPELLPKSILLAIGQGDETQAKKQFKQLKQQLKNTELNDQKRLQTGKIAYWLSDNEYSLKMLQAITSGEQITHAKLIMAQIFMEKKQYPKATVLFRQVQNGEQQQAILAHILESNLWFEQDQKQQAINRLTQGLKTFPDSSKLLYNRALLYESTKQFPKMETDLKKIINQQPDHHEALNALGYFWADQNINLEQAYEMIKKAHQLDPKNIAILDSLGWIYYRKGNLQKAEQYLRLAVKDQPKEKLLYQHLATVLKARNKTEQLQAVEKIIESLSTKTINK